MRVGLPVAVGPVEAFQHAAGAGLAHVDEARALVDGGVARQRPGRARFVEVPEALLARGRVALGPDGLIAGIKPGAAYFDLSTNSPSLVKKLSAAFAEKGAHMLDAPVSGGPAGAATALLLARAGWSICVVERQAFPRRKVCGEFLSATNGPLLASLGLEEIFGDLAGPPVQRVGLMTGQRTLIADLPRPRGRHPWGRALGR